MSWLALCGSIRVSLSRAQNYNGGLNMAVTTTPICVKLDHHVLFALDEECRVTGARRNRLINEACDFYIKHLDDERRRKAGIL